jgi:DNA-binding CsgD family transcriptional regulator
VRALRESRAVRTPGPTERQREVLRRIAAGDLSKQIARGLGISEAGVRKHLESLRHRYGVATRAALVRVAIERGDLEVDVPDQRLTGDRLQTTKIPSASTAAVSRNSSSDA